MKKATDPTASDPSPDDWLNCRQACLMAGVSRTAMVRAALVGKIQTKVEPGIPPLFNRIDVALHAKFWRQNDRVKALGRKGA
jgi:hypothetical protein